MARPKKQKTKCWKSKMDHGYEELWDDWRDEEYERWQNDNPNCCNF
jgi:hypothetical protein